MTKNIKRSKLNGMRVFDYVNYIILCLFSLLCLFPVIYVLLLSFSSRQDYMQATLFVLPKNFNLENYKAILLQGRIGNAFGISVFITVVGVLYSMTLTSLGAYAFTKRQVPGMRFFFTLAIITMFFGGGLVPFYLTIRDTVGLNNLASLIIPFGINTFNMILLRNFFGQIPQEIIESCKLDGAGEFTILFRIMLPLSTAGIATVSLFYLVAKWDEWYWASLLLRDNKLYPLALELRLGLNAESETTGGGWDLTIVFQQGINAAMIVISLLPIMLIYPFLQKYFVKGVMIGAVKG